MQRSFTPPMPSTPEHEEFRSPRRRKTTQSVRFFKDEFHSCQITRKRRASDSGPIEKLPTTAEALSSMIKEADVPPSTSRAISGVTFLVAMSGLVVALLRSGFRTDRLSKMDSNSDGKISYEELSAAALYSVGASVLAFAALKALQSVASFVTYALQARRRQMYMIKVNASSPFHLEGHQSVVDEEVVEYLETNFDRATSSGRRLSKSRSGSEMPSLPSRTTSRKATAESYSEYRRISCGNLIELGAFDAFDKRSGPSEPSEDSIASVELATCFKDPRDGSEKLQELAHRLPNWDFDVFEVEGVAPKPLVFIGFVCLDAYTHPSLLNINKPKLLHFLDDVDRGYRTVPYHNSLHGASVARSLYSFCMNGLSFSQEYMEFALVLAGLVHDINHPGLTPSFLIKATSMDVWQTPPTAPLKQGDIELACKYNDQSILESMHCAVAFELLRREKNAFLSKEDLTQMRKPLIKSILGTDMAKHAETMTRLFTLLENLKHPHESGAYAHPWYWPAKPPAHCNEAQRLEWEYVMQEEFTMELFVHAADLANPTLPFPQWKKWNALVQLEFNMQGDLEKETFGELISPPAGFDRNASALAVHVFTKGFMQFLALPLFESLGELTEISSETCVARGVNISMCLNNLRKNLELWDEDKPKDEGDGNS